MEINEYRKQVTQLEMELESLRGTNDYLERNLAGKISCYFFCFKLLIDVEKRSEVEINTYQQRVNRLQAELDRSTNDMKKHLAEYKNLMNVKQSLEKVRIFKKRITKKAQLFSQLSSELKILKKNN